MRIRNLPRGQSTSAAAPVNETKAKARIVPERFTWSLTLNRLRLVSGPTPGRSRLYVNLTGPTPIEKPVLRQYKDRHPFWTDYSPPMATVPSELPLF
jgi:hypothetical protein